MDEEKEQTVGRRVEVRGEVDQRERRPTALKPAPWKDGGAAAAAEPARTEAERTATEVVRAIEAEEAARREAARRRREEAFMMLCLKKKGIDPRLCKWKPIGRFFNWEAGR